MKAPRRKRVALPPGLQRSLRTSIERAETAWAGLATREKRLVVLCGAVVIGALCWLAAIEPALKSIDRWQGELPRLRSQSAAVEAVLSEVPAPRATPADTQAYQAALTRQLEAAQLGGAYQLTADGAAGWRVAFNGVPPATLIPWLLTQPAQLHLRLAEVSLRRTDTAAHDASAAALSGSVRLVPDSDAKDLP
ncbi:General secretion pathway%2C M protein [Bordetella ansorpii]|uniref:General secretion pathway, M protein n=1 Tax=Bordetella ansorpii TaxID=288768 RepID=A0A157SFV7_9BORD|nr:type II secretion system protein GspM [Bordetella ansorpii]SAI69111.1 General secretion pathway%2C M protein [Bordetella ansorpii]